MATPFSPTPQDVDRYRSLRALSRDLNNRLVRTIPKQAFDDVGAALGLLHDGVLVLETEDVSAVMADCCLHDWHKDGKNLVQRYAEEHIATLGTVENYLLQAYCNAKYRVLAMDSAVPGAGHHCRDILNGGELFLMDVSFSRNCPCGDVALATRTIPLGEYWMSGGAALPIDSETDFESALRRSVDELPDWCEEGAMLPIAIVRACLAAGAAEHVSYATPKAKPRMPRWPGSKRRRRKPAAPGS